MASSLHEIISAEPPSGIVAASAIACGLSLRVLRAVLEITAAKHDSPRLQELIAAAGRETERMLRYAEEDANAYAAFTQARRERRPAAEIQAALRCAVETPLAAARAAVDNVDLCREASEMVSGAIEADITGAAALLAGSARAMLCTVDMNLRGVTDESFAHEMRLARLSIEDRLTVLAREVWERKL